MGDKKIQSSGGSEKSGLKQLLGNLLRMPRNLWGSAARQGNVESPRARSETVFQNLFLHIHSVRVHRWTLKKSFTLGLGVICAVLFIILIVTGVILMVYYKPSVAEAYNSIKDIHYVVPGGRLVRNIHYWATQLMVIAVFLHMARAFLTRSYQKPREFNWVIGVVLLVLTLALSFSGYCLPWDQLAYWAVVIGSNIVGALKELTDALGITGLFNPGDMMRNILLGSRSIGGEAILRFYWFHCIMLPILMVILIAVHFWRIRKDGGLSRPDDIRPEELRGIPKDDLAESSFRGEEKTYSLMCLVPGSSDNVDRGPENTVMSWPHLLSAEMAIFMIVLAAVLFLGLFFDAPLKIAANPNVPENPAKAPWYFLGVQELVSYSAFAGGMLIPLLAVLALVSIPFLDREKGPCGRWPRGRALYWVLISGAFSLITVVALLAFVVNFGWLRDWVPQVSQLWVILFNPATVLLGLFFIYSLFVVRRTGSTRLGAIAVFLCILISFTVLTYFGTIHRGPNWDFYWWPSLWPRY